MTPEKARELLNAIPNDGFAAPETQVTPALAAAAPALAGLVAGMRLEYAVQYFFHGEWQDTRYRRDTKQEAELVRRLYPQYDTRVVRRLTTEWEEAE